LEQGLKRLGLPQKNPAPFRGRRRALDPKQALGRQAGPFGPNLVKERADFQQPSEGNVPFQFHEVGGLGDFAQASFDLLLVRRRAQGQTQRLPHLGSRAGLQVLQKEWKF
jgi:hypothetical protein